MRQFGASGSVGATRGKLLGATRLPMFPTGRIPTPVAALKEGELPGDREPSSTRIALEMSQMFVPFGGVLESTGRRCVLATGLIVALVAGCQEPTARRASFPGLGDDALIQDIDADVELRTTVIDLPEVGRAEILYAVRDGRAMWTGDILLGDADEVAQGFRGASLTNGLWPNKTLKYRYGASLTGDAKSALQSAMAKMEASTSIRFVETAAGDTSGFVRFTSSDDGCFAFFGAPPEGESKQLNLGAGCEDEETAIHELGHALGLFHEQTRADRDEYVDIDWSNISEGNASQFDKYSKSGLAGADRGAYDYNSIMHYGSDAFAKDGSKPVIVKKDGSHIAWATKMSSGDIAAIEAMYAGEGEGDGKDDGMPMPEPGDGEVGSCVGRCGTDDAVDAGGGEACFCDLGCIEYGDCCEDRAAACGGDEPSGEEDDGAPAATCEGVCGSAAAQTAASGDECYCDDICSDNGDCCSDHAVMCGGESPTPEEDEDTEPGEGSCFGHCDGPGSEGESCFCDAECAANGDCCSDVAAACSDGGGGGPTCQGNCGNESDQGGCFCDPTCEEYGDCCDDRAAWCG